MPRNQHRWSSIEDALFFEPLLSLAEIAELVGVSKRAAESRAVTLRRTGLKVPSRKTEHQWAAAEIALIFDPDVSVAEISEATGVTPEGVRQKMVKLRKQGREIPSRTHALGMIGKTFDRLTVEANAGSRGQSGSQRRYWLCLCICGNRVEVPTSHLRNGNTRSCGCFHLETVTANGYGQIHGHAVNSTTTPTYVSWVSMRQRCRENPSYIRRGITVVRRWERFENFLADMGERPEGTTLERVDNEGPYAPWNCRWADAFVQLNNRSNSWFETFDGRTQTVAQWAREYGIPATRLYDRLGRGWDFERALTEVPRGSSSISRT